jgi:hypothetical protein
MIGDPHSDLIFRPIESGSAKIEGFVGRKMGARAGVSCSALAMLGTPSATSGLAARARFDRKVKDEEGHFRRGEQPG